LNIEEGED